MRHLLTLSALLLTLISFAQTDSLKSQWSLAFDVSPYAMKGNSVKLSFIGKNCQKWEIHTEFFSMEYPKLMLNLNPANKTQDWTLKVNRGISLYTDYKVSTTKPIYIGTAFVHLTEELGLNDQTTEYTLFEMLLRVHYKWYPGDQSNFFVNPYFAFGGRGLLSGNHTIDGNQFEIIKAISLASIYLGYSF